MKISNYYTSIDTHTCGDPTRTVTGGVGPIPGRTILEKMEYLRDNRDHIRRTLMLEPRGNEVQSGVILTDPCNPEADFGVIFIEVGGYLTMCGHDTIGVATALIEAGVVEPLEPETRVVLDTPIGIVPVRVKVEDGRALEVSFKNQPAFVFARDVEIKVPELDWVTVDICYGGLFYAILDAQTVNLTLAPQNKRQIIQTAISIRETINLQADIVHPEEPSIRGVSHVLFSSPAKQHPDAHLANAVVIPPGSVCRSPCGTGTCAKVAQLCQRGGLKPGDPFIHESAMTGTIFKATPLESVQVGQYEAVFVKITGSAYVTGMNTYVVDPHDPLRHGFSLPV